MKATQELKELMFNATKLVDNSQQPAKYRVRGYPNSNNNFTDYANFSRDFTFASYEKVIAGGLLRCQRLFNKPYTDIIVHKLNYGRSKQWFICELIAQNTKVKIDGELHYPYLCITYSYDRVNAINYEIGIYREKCSNGILLGFKSLMKIKATPETLFDVDPYFNPCMLSQLVKEYERQTVMLKNTKLNYRTIEILISSATGRNVRHDDDSYFVDEKGALNQSNHVRDLIGSYSEEIGQNAYTVLNVITDLASNPHDEMVIVNEPDSINNTITAAQRKAGKWLEQFIEYIEKQNSIELITDMDNENFGSKPHRNTYDFNLEAYLHYIKSSN